MSTTFDQDDEISSSAVDSRIAELESELEGAKPWKVRRSEFPYPVIESFEDEESAEDFITAEDYDPDRVEVIEDDKLEDERTELEELEEFRRDARNTFGTYEWNSGLTLTDGAVVDSDYAENYFSENYGSWPDELDGYINWRQVAGDFLAGRDYVSLDGQRYYDL